MAEEPISDWVELPKSAITHYKLYYSVQLDKNKWVGYPDPNYVWEGERLVWERTVKDEDGNDVTVKTYRKPIEIIAKFKPETKVYGIDNKGAIERAAVKKFGGSLKGFIWIEDMDNDGGGEVILPFIAPNIFIVRGDRLNPELTEIFTDSNDDNYYEIFEGKTHVYVKSFSGIGGAAGAPSTLIAHWKMNEDFANDNAELVSDGDFDGTPAGVWTLGTGWSIAGGVAHCNGDQIIYSNLTQDCDFVVGRKYKTIFTLSNWVSGTIRINCGGSSPGPVRYSDGTYEDFLVSSGSALSMTASSNFAGDVDNISVKLCAAEDASGNDHDGLLQKDTDAASVAGKISTAFDFDGAADYIEIGDNDGFTPALTPFSGSIWVNLHEATDCPIITKGVEGTDGEWRLYTDGSDKLFFRQYDESIDKYIGRTYAATALPENEWLHIVFTSDGGTLCSGINLYVNGIDVDDADDESATFVAVENLTGPVWIGYDGTNYANGIFDNVTIFSIELTQDEVNILYNSGSGTEIIAELDPQISPRRGNLSPFALRRRYEFA